MTRSFHWRTTFWTAGTFLLLLTLPMAMFSMSQKKKPKTWICFVSPALHQCIWETWSKFGSEAVSGFCDFVTQGLMFHSFSEKHRSNTVDWLRVSYESYVCDHICAYIFLYAHIILNLFTHMYIFTCTYIYICVILKVSTEHQPIATTVDLDHATLIRKWWSHDMAKGRCILPWQTWNSAEEAWWDKMHQWNRFDCNPITDFQKAGFLPSGMFPAR